MHVRLMRMGWSILVYDAVPSEDGALAAAQLHNVFAYVAAHRSFKYCQVLLMTEGCTAGAAFRAIAEDRGTSITQLKAMTVSQPEVFGYPSTIYFLGTLRIHCSFTKLP